MASNHVREPSFIAKKMSVAEKYPHKGPQRDEIMEMSGELHQFKD